MLPGPRRLRRWLRIGSLSILVSCFAALVLIVALAVTMPASALRRFVDLPPQVTDLQGTVWSGTARLTDGYTVQWRTQLAALILARITAVVTLTGADTQVIGSVQVSPWSIAVRDVEGRVGAGVLRLVPGLLIDGCATRAVVDVTLARFGGGQAAADGRINIEAGTCRDLGGNVIPVPAMTLTLRTEGTDAVAALADATQALAQVTVAGDRRLLIRVEPAGAALIPGMPSSGPTILEYPF